MATIRVGQDTDATGTVNDDMFQIVTPGAGTSMVDGADGDDNATFYDTSDYQQTTQVEAGELSMDGDNLVYDGTDNSIDDGVTLSNFESVVFSNGLIDLTMDGIQYLAVSNSGNSFSADTILAFDPEAQDSLQERDVEIQSVNGSNIAPGSSVSIDGQGTVSLDNNDTLTFTPLTSYASSIGIGQSEEISFDVSYLDENGTPDDDSDDQTVTFTYTTTVDGEASNGADRFTGTEMADNVNALGGNDTLNGNQGDDNLYGAAGDDRIFAGPNDDGENGATTAAGGTARADYNDAFAGGAGDDIIGGGAGDDILTGDDDSRVIDATGGNFSADADGDDVIYGGAGNDEIHTGSWLDSEQDAVNGDVHSGEGNDTAYGGDGNDIIIGDNGEDVLGGGDGNDTINSGGGDDTVYGGVDFGEDEIDAGNGNDLVFGGAGNDDIFGNGGDDTLYNGAGDDTVDGGNGRDTIWGGEGNDELTGGGDIDTFGFVAGNGNDTITDFDEAEDLVLASELGFDNFEDLSANLGTVDSNAVLFYGEGDSVTFDGTAVADLSEDNFVF